jgi:RNA polymerase sigma-70 factor, ECF subfamily
VLVPVSLQGFKGDAVKLAAAEFERLALEQLDMVFRMAKRLARDFSRAEDLVQETYVRAFQGRETFSLQQFGIRPWLFRILNNLYLTRREQDGRQAAAMEDIQLDRATSWGNVHRAVSDDPQNLEWMDEEIAQAVNNLAAEYRCVLMLWAVEDFSYKEISEALDIPEGTVMSRLYRARQQLMAQLHEYAVKERRIRE